MKAKRIYYPVNKKHTIGNALKCNKCNSAVVWIFNHGRYNYTRQNGRIKNLNNKDYKICSCKKEVVNEG